MAFCLRGNCSFCDTICQVNRSQLLWKSAQAKLAWYKSTAIHILYKCRSDVSFTALMSVKVLHYSQNIASTRSADSANSMLDFAEVSYPSPKEN
jgi:hypothetical protein